jgi:hypothetical protein
MRRCAKRMAMRRISTDQRAKALDSLWHPLWRIFSARGWRGDGSSPAWQTSASAFTDGNQADTECVTEFHEERQRCASREARKMTGRRQWADQAAAPGKLRATPCHTPCHSVSACLRWQTRPHPIPLGRTSHVKRPSRMVWMARTSQSMTIQGRSRLSGKRLALRLFPRCVNLAGARSAMTEGKRPRPW